MPAFERWTFDSQSGLVGVAVIVAIPEAECAKEVKHLDLNKDDLLIERPLGVRWCTKTVTFGFKTDLRPCPST